MLCPASRGSGGGGWGRGGKMADVVAAHPQDRRTCGVDGERAKLSKRRSKPFSDRMDEREGESGHRCSGWSDSTEG